ncbi:hypothetical protein [Pseudidiomarina woesei]|uniref:SOS cell division inhibitor SulA n=1 Tax=Pseudidiomarina woesei TaxID=1381080 RepID=A0A0K6HDA6_9GAMM|nr:hypothetical protein [Pseudidiomarina woesei]CUA88818.1 hypothetical protein Ga0061064_2346 [Pseudidiomarina woesei]
MAFPAQVEALVKQGLVWQGQQAPLHRSPSNVLTTGWPELDQRLGGGWLQGCVHELQLQQQFIGELTLLLPLLSQPNITTLWINPPATPYAPGLIYQDIALLQQVIVQEPDNKLALWAAEQAVQSKAVDLVLFWHTTGLSAAAVRRLQQAAEAAQKTVFIVTAIQPEDDARAYAMRLRLTKIAAAPLQVEVLKRRYGWPLPPFPCAIESRLPRRRRVL